MVPGLNPWLCYNGIKVPDQSNQSAANDFIKRTQESKNIINRAIRDFLYIFIIIVIFTSLTKKLDSRN